MDSTVGLAIQCVGILLVTLLSFFMRASTRSLSLKYWTAAWTCLAISLTSLLAGFHSAGARQFYYSVYFLGEYVFGLLFIAGCRNYVNGSRLGRSHLYQLALAVCVALILSNLSSDFNELFIIHAAIMSGLFLTALGSLKSAFTSEKTSPGLKVMAAALLLLALDFLHYVPVFWMRKTGRFLTIPATYVQYTSIFDLILEILLGFGTVMVLMEGVRREVERANEKLRQSRDRLQESRDRLLRSRDRLQSMAQMDPLTEALNRHAFHSLLTRSESDENNSGCLAVIDIDNLKPINDSLGHSVGDKAIRAVARAVRSLIRADDMLFRWGGDEFLVLMFKLSEGEVTRRMETLNEILEENTGQWTAEPVKLSVTFGVAGFLSLAQVGAAIETADKAMYEKRQLQRSKNELQFS